MKAMIMKTFKLLPIFLIMLSRFIPIVFLKAEPGGDVLQADLTHSKKVSPVKYGWHYEEIGMIGEGGLYTEVVPNSALEEANLPKGMDVKDGYYADVPDPTITTLSSDDIVRNTLNSK